MIALVATIALMVVVYFIQRSHPAIAGLLAVVPVKIIGTAFMADNSYQLVKSIEGMLVGQFFIGFALLGVYFYLKV